MGLDMYAYTINANLVDDNRQTDVEVYKIARKAVGFVEPSDEKLDNMSDDDRRSYWTQKTEADEKARESGVFDPNFAYWRKFNNLHQWMANLYYAKGGASEDFNCNTVRLMNEDLDELCKQAATLKPASGFFWGDEDEMTQEDIDDVQSFITRAREAIHGGKAVFYDSWW